jgi:hypothetical protein
MCSESPHSQKQTGNGLDARIEYLPTLLAYMDFHSLAPLPKLSILDLRKPGDGLGLSYKGRVLPDDCRAVL